MSAPVAAVAARVRLTEGQLYTVAITLVASLLLATGLGNVHGVVSSALTQPVLELPPAQQLPPVTVPTAAPSAPPLALPEPSLPPFDTGAEPFPQPEPAPPPTTEPAPPSDPPAGPSPSPTPTPSACAAQPVNDGAAQVIRLLDESAGGALPDEDLLAAIALVTGCSKADPAVVALGLLIGAGQTLPPMEGVEPPVVPVLVVPPSVVTALQPARPAVDQICGLVGTGQAVASLFITAYPRPLSQLTVQALFQALSVCGQVRNP